MDDSPPHRRSLRHSDYGRRSAPPAGAHRIRATSSERTEPPSTPPNERLRFDSTPPKPKQDLRPRTGLTRSRSLPNLGSFYEDPSEYRMIEDLRAEVAREGTSFQNQPTSRAQEEKWVRDAVQRGLARTRTLLDEQEGARERRKREFTHDYHKFKRGGSDLRGKQWTETDPRSHEFPGRMHSLWGRPIEGSRWPERHNVLQRTVNQGSPFRLHEDSMGYVDHIMNTRRSFVDEGRLRAPRPVPTLDTHVPGLYTPDPNRPEDIILEEDEDVEDTEDLPLQTTRSSFEKPITSLLPPSPPKPGLSTPPKEDRRQKPPTPPWAPERPKYLPIVYRDPALFPHLAREPRIAPMPPSPVTPEKPSTSAKTVETTTSPVRELKLPRAQGRDRTPSPEHFVSIEFQAMQRGKRDVAGPYVPKVVVGGAASSPTEEGAPFQFKFKRDRPPKQPKIVAPPKPEKGKKRKKGKKSAESLIPQLDQLNISGEWGRGSSSSSSQSSEEGEEWRSKRFRPIVGFPRDFKWPPARSQYDPYPTRRSKRMKTSDTSGGTSGGTPSVSESPRRGLFDDSLLSQSDQSQASGQTKRTQLDVSQSPQTDSSTKGKGKKKKRQLGVSLFGSESPSEPSGSGLSGLQPGALQMDVSESPESDSFTFGGATAGPLTFDDSQIETPSPPVSRSAFDVRIPGDPTQGFVPPAPKPIATGGRSRRGGFGAETPRSSTRRDVPQSTEGVIPSTVGPSTRGRRRRLFEDSPHESGSPSTSTGTGFVAQLPEDPQTQRDVSPNRAPEGEESPVIRRRQPKPKPKKKSNR